MQDRALTTIAEQSGFGRTGRSDEVTRLCAAFAAAWPHEVQSLEFGHSAEGRPLRGLLVSRADARSVPAAEALVSIDVEGRHEQYSHALEHAAPGALGEHLA